MIDTSLTALADALVAMGYENGQTLGGLQPLNLAAKEERLEGPVLPVEALEGSTLFVHVATYSEINGRIMVVSTGTPFYEACSFIGDIQAFTAYRRGCKGIVIDGYVRDKKGLDEVPIPVWGRGFRPNAGSKKEAGQVGSPINIAGTTIRLDDYLIADEDGVLVIPKEQLMTAQVSAGRKDAKDKERKARVAAFDFTGNRDYESLMAPAVQTYFKSGKLDKERLR